jgi:hypothetical protein
MPGSSDGLHRSLYAPGDVVTVGRTGRPDRMSELDHRTVRIEHGSSSVAPVPPPPLSSFLLSSIEYR